LGKKGIKAAHQPQLARLQLRGGGAAHLARQATVDTSAPPGGGAGHARPAAHAPHGTRDERDSREIRMKRIVWERWERMDESQEH
jgi:hypothetical protein